MNPLTSIYKRDKFFATTLLIFHFSTEQQFVLKQKRDDCRQTPTTNHYLLKKWNFSRITITIQLLLTRSIPLSGPPTLQQLNLAFCVVHFCRSLVHFSHGKLATFPFRHSTTRSTSACPYTMRWLCASWERQLRSCCPTERTPPSSWFRSLSFSAPRPHFAWCSCRRWVSNRSLLKSDI